tara:strand:- start:150 stop:437 length:288 start_codon:yes stop_codon:yes gene_type:complete
MSFIKHAVLVRDILPKDIIQKANQFGNINNIPDSNLDSRNELIKYLLYVTYYKFGNENSSEFFKLFDRENCDLTILQLFDELTFQQLLIVKDSFK